MQHSALFLIGFILINCEGMFLNPLYNGKQYHCGEGPG